MPTELERLRSDVRMSQEYLIVFVAIIIWDTVRLPFSHTPLLDLTG